MLEKNKNLLFLCGYKSLYGGNFVPCLMALEDKLKTYSVNCIYAFPKEARDRPWIEFLESEGRRTTFLDFDLPNRKFNAELTRVVSDFQINYVYSHFSPILKVELFAKQHKDICVFIHIHSDFSAGKKTIKTTLKTFAMYKLFSGQVSFFSVSKAFVRYNSKKISYVPNCLADRRIANTHIGGKAIREQNHVGNSEVLCEIFGWSPIVKGVDIAVNAIKALNEEKNVDVKLAIICGREMSIKRMKEWIALNTRCSGEEEYLLYWEPQEDVFSFHEASDILLAPSRSEGFPYSLLEMLSLGKTCVISDVPGMKWAEEYKTVFSFSTENLDRCIKAICDAIQSDCVCDVDVAESIKKNYSIDAWTDTIINKMNHAV